MNTLLRMRRPSLLASATAIVLFLAAATTSAASPETGTIVNVELGLKTNNGLRAQLETSDDETVTLELRDKDQLVSYEVRGEVTREGLKVRFGRLGLIDVAFTPTRTLSSTEPSEGCTGEPRTLREGTFAGTIDFTGERNYVRIKAAQVEGSMSVISQWHCPEEPTPLARTAQPLALNSRSEEKAASLGASAFVVDLMAGTATVRPPRPFRGQATLKRGLGDHPLWRSTIRMPFLGAASINPQGPDLSVDLDPGYDFFDPGPDFFD